MPIFQITFRKIIFTWLCSHEEGHYKYIRISGAYAVFSEGGCREGGGVPRSAKEANNPILLKVQSLQLSFRPAGVSLGEGGGGGPRPPLPPPPLRTPLDFKNPPIINEDIEG